jgi:hypothetical protein
MSLVITHAQPFLPTLFGFEYQVRFLFLYIEVVTQEENFAQFWKIITTLGLFLIISEFGYHACATFPA